MAQFGRPASDITVSSWTTSPLWSKIDEVSADDGDYIESITNADTCECALNSVTDPVSSTGHSIFMRAWADGTGSAERIAFSLIQGTTSIASSTFAITRSSFNDYTLNLTGGEADSITNYGDLRLRFTSNLVSTTETVRVSQAYFTCPDASGTNPQIRRFPMSIPVRPVGIGHDGVFIFFDRFFPKARGILWPTPLPTSFLTLFKMRASPR